VKTFCENFLRKLFAKMSTKDELATSNLASIIKLMKLKRQSPCSL
jgi:hypothetical protein